MTNSELKQAQEWADKTLNNYPFPSHEGVAARLIQSLPDQWIDAERLREALDGWSLAGKALRETDLGKRLEALLPANLPTLADMTPEERAASQFMQARLADGTLGIIVHPDDLRSSVISKDGGFFTLYNGNITPLPGEPKLKWPGSEPPALPEGMRLADHEKYGRAVVSPEDDLDGDYRVFYSQDNTEYGATWRYAHKSKLTFLDGGKNEN